VYDEDTSIERVLHDVLNRFPEFQDNSFYISGGESVGVEC
jgi:hypothetical protein